VVCEELGQPAQERGVRVVVRTEAGVPRPRPLDRAHGDDRGTQPLRDVVQHPVRVRADPVDLVDEDQRGDAQPMERPHEDAGLRLDALHRGDDEDGAVEHAEGPFHLGDEVRVPGGVDEVDGDVVDGERHDGRPDGDAALPLERQGVGLRAAGIHTADLVDDTGDVEQPLGKGRLTGVDVRQDAQVECGHASCPLCG